MSAEHNPLIPAGYDIVWSVVSVVVIALAVLALVSLARSARRLSTWQTLGWTLAILFAPVLGSLAWLTIGRRSLPAERNG